MKKALLLLIAINFSVICFSQDTDFYNTYFEGNALLSKAQYDKAIEKHTLAIKLYPKADYTYFNRGNAYYKKKDFANALKDYDQTLKLNSDYAEAYFQRGLTKVPLGDKTLCDDFKKAEKLKMTGSHEALKLHCK